MTTNSTAYEVALGLMQANSGKRFAYNNENGVVGVWDQTVERFRVTHSQIIGGGGWCVMPYEILVNGKLIPIDWHPLIG